ncbi:predicted protein [Nematostella vectensis]|uniref:Metallo-beta-lactamase domain-containing protein n=1 Tax=Nematostella vectensis TaxID=45351 RepID=A7S7X0_NEMVE|nr:predicted protein [Nematostella vectensis]|eukprot:XP_001632211.1 predicted protein [Nematostella vectensis]
MEIHFLGTGSAYPTPHRGASCVILWYNGSCWMFDCGEGTQTQLTKSVIKSSKITKIFISHLHGDHVFGLPGLLCTIGLTAPDENKHVDIYGPVGLRKYLRTSLDLCQSILGYSYAIHEIHTADSTSSQVTAEVDLLHPDENMGREIHENPSGVWEICKDGDLQVFAAPLKHRVTCFGYVVEEKDQPGALDAALLKSKGVPPGPLYAKIKNGESVTTSDGVVVDPKDVLGPSRPGRKVVILGDTCDSSAIENLAYKADCVIHEATLEDEMKEKAIENGHSTPGMAGAFAKTIQAKQLVLTHFSQRYKDSDSVAKHVQQATHAFSCDRVLAASDFSKVVIPLQK